MCTCAGCWLFYFKVYFNVEAVKSLNSPYILSLTTKSATFLLTWVLITIRLQTATSRSVSPHFPRFRLTSHIPRWVWTCKVELKWLSTWPGSLPATLPLSRYVICFMKEQYVTSLKEGDTVNLFLRFYHCVTIATCQLLTKLINAVLI